MGEGSAAVQKGEGLTVMGGGGSLMIHSADSVTNQSVAFKYVMASVPYTGPPIILKRSWQVLPYIKIYFIKNT
jgi:hypothetical protein